MAEIQGVPPSDTSPDKSIPLPIPPSSSLPRDIPSLQSLRSWLPLYLSKADTTISHLNRVLSTPSGTDTLLLTIRYSTLASSAILSTLALRRLHAYLIRLTLSLPTPTAKSLIPSTTHLIHLSQSLEALSSLISDSRVFVRLWGLLGIWKWGQDLLANPPVDPVLKHIAWAQVAVNVPLQVLENGAYLASKGVLGWDARRQTRAWLWSSRFWAAHVGIEFGKLGYLWRVRAARAKGKGKGKEVVEKDDEEEVLAWKRSLVSSLAYAPLTMHWSLENGLVDDMWVGILGTVAGTVGMTQLWKTTA